jgi:hypothetical protein
MEHSLQTRRIQVRGLRISRESTPSHVWMETSDDACLDVECVCNESCIMHPAVVLRQRASLTGL